MTEIETIPAEDTEQRITFTTDELTALCPFDFGGPDYYDLTIRYEPDALLIESKSLKMLLEEYRDREITAEGIADELYQIVAEAVKPASLYIRVEQARRGGIEETVEAGDYELRN